MLLSNLLRRCRRHTLLHDSLSLVDVATSCNDSIILLLVTRLMISWEHPDLASCFHADLSKFVASHRNSLCRPRLYHRVRGVLRHRAYSTTIAYVHDVDVIVYYHDDDGAWASLIVRLIWRWARLPKKVIFSLVSALSDSLVYFWGKLRL